jgi:rhamnogalacturonyl hydrolase YesR
MNQNAVQVSLVFAIVLASNGYAHGKIELPFPTTNLVPDKQEIFRSPTPNGYVVDGLVPITMWCPVKPINHNAKMNLNFVHSQHWNIWYARYQVNGFTSHVLPIDISCGVGPLKKRFTRNIVVNNISHLDRSPARKMSNMILQHKPANELGWDWADAVMLFGAETWAKPNQADYAPVAAYIQDYQKHFGSMKKPPAITYSDRCPSALTALSTWEQFDQPESLNNLNRVLKYIREAPRNKVGAINHLGGSIGGKILPIDSIWVDSLVMYALLSVKAGVALDDEALLNFGLNQQVIFAKKMIQPKTGLYYHAWNVTLDNPFPSWGIQWLRGNGWVATSLVLMLQELEKKKDLTEENKALKTKLEILTQQLAKASLPYMTTTKMFDTWMPKPGGGYEESSGTALIAYMYVQGAKMGILDKSYGEVGLEIYRHLTARLQAVGSDRISMPEISGPTNPTGPTGYVLWVKRKSDLPYGQGAYLLLASVVNGEQ